VRRLSLLLNKSGVWGGRMEMGLLEINRFEVPLVRRVSLRCDRLHLLQTSTS